MTIRVTFECNCKVQMQRRRTYGIMRYASSIPTAAGPKLPQYSYYTHDSSQYRRMPYKYNPQDTRYQHPLRMILPTFRAAFSKPRAVDTHAQRFEPSLWLALWKDVTSSRAFHLSIDASHRYVRRRFLRPLALPVAKKIGLETCLRGYCTFILRVICSTRNTFVPLADRFLSCLLLMKSNKEDGRTLCWFYYEYCFCEFMTRFYDT